MSMYMKKFRKCGSTQSH